MYVISILLSRQLLQRSVCNHSVKHFQQLNSESVIMHMHVMQP